MAKDTFDPASIFRALDERTKTKAPAALDVGSFQVGMSGGKNSNDPGLFEMPKGQKLGGIDNSYATAVNRILKPTAETRAAERDAIDAAALERVGLTPADMTTTSSASAASGVRLEVPAQAKWSEITTSPQYKNMDFDTQSKQRQLYVEANVNEYKARVAQATGKPVKDNDPRVQQFRQALETNTKASLGPRPEWSIADSDYWDAAKRGGKSLYQGLRLALGDQETADDAKTQLREITREWNENKSAYTRNQEKLRARERAAFERENAAQGKEGLTAGQEATLGWRSFWDSPIRNILGSAPSMLPTIAAGAATSVLTGGNVAAGAAAASGVNALLTAGDVVSQVVDTVDNASPEELAANPVYQRLLAANNGDAARAKNALIDVIADEAKGGAALLGGVAGLATPLVGAGKIAADSLTKVLAKNGFSAATKTGGLGAVNTAMNVAKPGLARRTAVGMAGEGVQEFVEEGGGQIIGNLAARDAGGFDVDPLDGAVESGVMGALAGAGTSAGVQAAGAGAGKLLGPKEDNGDVIAAGNPRSTSAQDAMVAARSTKAADASNLAVNRDTGLMRLIDTEDENRQDPLSAALLAVNSNENVLYGLARTEGLSEQTAQLTAISGARTMLGPNWASTETVNFGPATAPVPVSFRVNGDGTVSFLNNGNLPADLVTAAQTAEQTANEAVAKIKPGLETFFGRTRGDIDAPSGSFSATNAPRPAAPAAPGAPATTSVASTQQAPGTSVAPTQQAPGTTVVPTQQTPATTVAPTPAPAPAPAQPAPATPVAPVVPAQQTPAAPVVPAQQPSGETPAADTVRRVYRGTLAGLRGPGAASMRQRILWAATRRVVPRGQAGINAVIDALTVAFGLPANTAAGTERAIDAALAKEPAQQTVVPEQQSSQDIEQALARFETALRTLTPPLRVKDKGKVTVYLSTALSEERIGEALAAARGALSLGVPPQLLSVFTSGGQVRRKSVASVILKVGAFSIGTQWENSSSDTRTGTLAHEMGHVLDDKLSDVSQSAAWAAPFAELKAAYKRGELRVLAYPFGGRYKSMTVATKRSEAFAQAVEIYFTDTDALLASAPLAHRAVAQALADYQGLQNGRPAVSNNVAPAAATNGATDTGANRGLVRQSSVNPSGPGQSRGADRTEPGAAAGQSQPQGGVCGDLNGRDSSGAQAPLPGAPNVAGASGPDPRLAAVAEQYAAQNGIPYARQTEYVTVDEGRAQRIAQAYDDMRHAPQDPAVQEAYAEMIRQTRAQYAALERAGYRFTFFDDATDPYAGNPMNAMRDLRANQTMAVYGTYAGYGTEGVTQGAVADNPMLAETGLQWPDQTGRLRPVLANDLFRAVHDAFGHGLEGAGFRARGEENAWQAHVALFYGPAVGAITSETRGQNSWLNYGPYGERNRTATLENTVFADQKTGLMPSWTWTEGRLPPPAGAAAGQPQPQVTVTPRQRPILDDVTEEQIGVEELRDFTIQLPTGGSATGSIITDENGQVVADITWIRAGETAPGERAPQGTNTYGQVIAELAKLGVQSLYVGIQSPASRRALAKQVEAGVLTNPRSFIGLSVDQHPARFDIAADNIQDRQADTINVDGVERPRTNSNGQPIATSVFDRKGKRVADADTALTNFWRWFGDSKVVDADGRPLVVYHGTKFSRIGVFQGNRGVAGHFAFDPAIANDFAEDLGAQEQELLAAGEEDVGDGAQVYPAHLKAENIFDARNPEHVARVGAGPMYDYDGLESNVEAIRAAGFDSYYDFERGLDELTGIAVFDPTQIKSATGNRGTYGIDAGNIQDRVAPQRSVAPNLLRTPDRSPADALMAAQAGVAASPATAQRGAAQALTDGKSSNLVVAGVRGIMQALTDTTLSRQARLDRAKPFFATMGDKLVERFVDALVPMVRWVQALPLPKDTVNAILGAMYLAPNVRDSIIARAQSEHGGNELNAALSQMLADGRKKNAQLTAETVIRDAGYWVTARYALIKNQRMLEADELARDNAEAEWIRLQNDPQATPDEIQGAESAYRSAEAVYEDRQYALSQPATVNTHFGRPLPAGVSGPARPVGLAGGMNTAQAQAFMAVAERQFGRAKLEAMAAHVYRLNAFRMATDIESSRVAPDQAALFSPELEVLLPEMTALRDIAHNPRSTQQQIERARKTFIDKLAVSSFYVPTTGDPSKGFEQDVLGSGFKTPNVAKDRRLMGRTGSLANDGITASVGGMQRSASAAGWNDFTRAIAQAYDNMTIEQRQDAGMKRVKLTALDRLSDNMVIHGDYGYTIRDGSELNALRKENVEDRSGILRLAEVPTRAFAYGATQLNPLFGVINMGRDIWERSENLRGKQGMLVNARGRDVDTTRAAQRMISLGASGTVLSDLAKAIWQGQETKYGVLLREFEQYGGGGAKYSASLVRDRAALTLDIENGNSNPRKLLKALTTVVSKWNDVFDSVSAVSAYAALREQGMTKEAAAAAALDLMNFRKSGSFMPFVRALYAFAQPAVTGGANLANLLKTKTGRKRILGYVALFSLMLPILAGMMGEDDETGRDRMDLLDDYTKDRFLPIPIGDVIIKMPLGFGLPVLANIIARQGLGFAKGETSAGEAILEVAGRGLVPAFTPLEDVKVRFEEDPAAWFAQTFSPTVAKPVTNIAINRGGLGNNIVNEGFMDKTRFQSEQGAPLTAQEYKDIARGIRSLTGVDFAPEQVRELLRGYAVFAGAAGREALRAMIDNPNRELQGKETPLPFIGTFVANTDNGAIAEMNRFEDRGLAVIREANAQIPTGLTGEEAREARDQVELDPQDRRILDLYESWLESEKELRARSSALTRAGVAPGVNPERMSLREQRDATQARFIREFNQLVGR